MAMASQATQDETKVGWPQMISHYHPPFRENQVSQIRPSSHQVFLMPSPQPKWKSKKKIFQIKMVREIIIFLIECLISRKECLKRVQSDGLTIIPTFFIPISIHRMALQVIADLSMRDILIQIRDTFRKWFLLIIDLPFFLQPIHQVVLFYDSKKKFQIIMNDTYVTIKVGFSLLYHPLYFPRSNSIKLVSISQFRLTWRFQFSWEQSPDVNSTGIDSRFVYLFVYGVCINFDFQKFFK